MIIDVPTLTELQLLSIIRLLSSKNKYILIRIYYYVIIILL